MLILGAEVADGVTGDVRVVGDRVAEVGAGLTRLAGEETVAAGGGAVLPGLHDHHVHLHALAASRTSLSVGPTVARDPAGFAAVLRHADRRRPPGGWLRVVDYHEHHAGPLDRGVLDALAPGGPVRVQHASGALWVLNSAALAAVGADGPAPPGVERDPDGVPTGRIWRADTWLRARLPPPDVDLADVGAAGAAAGFTGFSDLTPGMGAADLAALRAAGADGRLPQRLHLAAALPAAAGVPTERGPVKVILDDDRLPTLDDLVATVRLAHAHRRVVALHCVTRVQAVLTLAALAEAGPVPGDRMEHAAVLGPDDVAALARLGVAVVTQPAMVRARGDRYLAEVDGDERPDLWRLGSLLRAGVTVAAGTDAPFGPFDPWLAVAAAADRRTAGGATLGWSERIGRRAALGLFLGQPDAPGVQRSLRPGQPADLIVLDRPVRAALAAPGGPEVVVTMVAGRVVLSRADAAAGPSGRVSAARRR